MAQPPALNFAGQLLPDLSGGVYISDERGQPVRLTPPHSLEAEQALLGAVLFDNAAFVDTDPLVTPEDFHEPFHGRLWRGMARLIRQGRLCEPAILAQTFSIDPAYEALGGIRYLADLIDRAPPAVNAPDYARIVNELASRRRLIQIGQELLHRASVDEEASAVDMMSDLERDLIQVRGGRDDFDLSTVGDVARSIVDVLESPPEHAPGVMTGLKELDKITGGLEPTDMLVLGGRPSMGKSAVAGCMALNMAGAYGTDRDPVGVIEINAEMNKEQMTRRHMTDLGFTLYGAAVPTYAQIRRREVTYDQLQLLRHVQLQLESLPLMMEKRAGITLGRIRMLVRRQKLKWKALGIKLGAVIVDHAGLVKVDAEHRARGRTEEQTIISGGLKEIADEFETVVIALAQLNRQVEQREDKRPQLADLRDSGSWEQDADMVFGVYRDSYYARRMPQPLKEPELGEWTLRCASREVEMIGLKVREGDIATAKLWADIARNAIRDAEPAFQPQSLFNAYAD